MRVDDVFCAVSWSGTTTASSQRGCDLLVADTSGKDHFERTILGKTWDLRHMMLRCTELVSCA